MDQTVLLFFLLSVFVTVFLLASLIIVPTFGTSAGDAQQLRRRLASLSPGQGDEPIVSIVRQKYLKKLSPIERSFESLPGTGWLSSLIEQAGHEYPVFRFILKTLAWSAVAGFAVWVFFHNGWGVAGAMVVAAFIPLFGLFRDRQKRVDAFDEQLPDAMDTIARALRSGYPFVEGLNYVARELPDPVAKEFGITFDEINYGREVNVAFYYLLSRMPSLSLTAMITAVIIQRETGGNLAEVLNKISGLLRGRFRFHRRVKTLSAEGRLSAWILALMPYFMFLVLNFVHPGYFNPLFENPAGKIVIGVGMVMILIGTIWVRQIVRIDV